ncbi:MAG TPA: type I phosphomannose isomerase catalytic subunit [Pontiella sp.]
MDNQVYPMLFEPVYKDYLWGGERIPKTYNRDLPPGVYAESWEIADHDDGMSVVSNGALSGKTLREILKKNSKDILGSNTEGDRFPLLIKLIDANKKLSVQVHPNNHTASLYGGDPKTEAWYLLGENEAQVYCQFKDGVTEEVFLDALKNKTAGDTINPITVKHGDMVFIRGGRVHAIDEKCLIYEVQQNSNTTYRICDWGRVDETGKSRELHIEQALKVINWDDHENPLIDSKLLVDTDTFRCWELLHCNHFKLEKLIYSAPLEVPMSGKTFHALFVAEGEAEISWEEESLNLAAGTSVLIPAALPHYTLSGNATILRSTIP